MVQVSCCQEYPTRPLWPAGTDVFAASLVGIFAQIDFLRVLSLFRLGFPGRQSQPSTGACARVVVGSNQRVMIVSPVAHVVAASSRPLLRPRHPPRCLTGLRRSQSVTCCSLSPCWRDWGYVRVEPRDWVKVRVELCGWPFRQSGYEATTPDFASCDDPSFLLDISQRCESWHSSRPESRGTLAALRKLVAALYGERTFASM